MCGMLEVIVYTQAWYFRFRFCTDKWRPFLSPFWYTLCAFFRTFPFLQFGKQFVALVQYSLASRNNGALLFLVPNIRTLIRCFDIYSWCCLWHLV